MKKIWVPFICGVLVLCFTGSCSRSDDDARDGPVLSSLFPDSKAVNMPGFRLTARGSGFSTFSSVYFGDSRVSTEFINSEELQCDIPASMISKEITVSGGGIPVKVNNGGGRVSEKLYFEIRANNSFYDSTLIFGGTVNYYNPSISVDIGGTLFIGSVRYTESEGLYSASLMVSDDQGMEWSEPVAIYSSSERIYNISIEAGPENQVFATFYCGKLLFSLSSDSGQTWSDPVELTPVTSSPVKSMVDSDSAGRIYILWLLDSDSSDNGIYFQRSDDNGVSFTPPVNISTDTSYFSSAYNPSFAVDDSGVYAAWTAWPSGGSRYSHVYFNYSTDRGETWGSADRYFGVASSSSLYAAGEGEVLLALSSSYLPFSNQIRLYRSAESGADWEDPVSVTEDSHDKNPLINRDSAGNINIIFERGNGFYYTRSINGGTLWTDPLFVTDRLSTGYRENRISLGMDPEGTLYVLSEYDFLGLLYLTISY